MRPSVSYGNISKEEAHAAARRIISNSNLSEVSREAISPGLSARMAQQLFVNNHNQNIRSQQHKITSLERSHIGTKVIVAPESLPGWEVGMRDYDSGLEGYMRIKSSAPRPSINNKIPAIDERFYPWLHLDDASSETSLPPTPPAVGNSNCSSPRRSAIELLKQNVRYQIDTAVSNAISDYESRLHKNTTAIRDEPVFTIAPQNSGNDFVDQDVEMYSCISNDDYTEQQEILSTAMDTTALSTTMCSAAQTTANSEEIWRSCPQQEIENVDTQPVVEVVNENSEIKNKKLLSRIDRFEASTTEKLNNILAAQSPRPTTSPATPANQVAVSNKKIAKSGTYYTPSGKAYKYDAETKKSTWIPIVKTDPTKANNHNIIQLNIIVK